MRDDHEVDWLDHQQQQAWRAYLRSSRLLEAELDRDLVEHGVQLTEYEILSMLSERPRRRARMSELADLVVQSRSRLTHTAARLEQRGWVERQPCEGDRRGVELVLTAEGDAVLGRVAPHHVASVRTHLVDPLSRGQLLALGESMCAVRAGLESSGRCDAKREGDIQSPRPVGEEDPSGC